MSWKTYKLVVENLPLPSVQPIAAELHKALDYPELELRDSEFGMYAAVGSFSIQYRLNDEQKERLIQYLSDNFLQGALIPYEDESAKTERKNAESIEPHLSEIKDDVN